MIIKNKTIVVWFSCGAASAVAAFKTIEKYGENNKIILVNNPVIEEDSDNLRFLKDCEKWLNKKIVFAKNTKIKTISAVEVWENVKYMSNRYGAPCTTKLKKEARYEYEKKVNIDFHVLGYTVDEKHRHERFIKYERDNVLSVLIDFNLTKKDCFKIIEDAGIKLPEVYYLGYPNANCIGCVKASSPTYWNHVRKMHPKIFKERAEQSRRLGAKLAEYKGKRIFLDELNPDAKGYKMKSHECGIFCNTKDKL
jgi:PP-loop superfamily ATP-utilizing enzyme